MSPTVKKALPVSASAVILWAVLTFSQGAVLKKTSDLSLFLFDWNFLRESFLIPGGFLGWAGSFFTQFLNIPWLGALIWVLLLLLAGTLTARTVALPQSLRPLAAVPVALLVIANMSLGYGMFIMRPQDYFFAPTLGYLLMLGIAAAAWRIPTLWGKLAVIAVSAFAGFYLAGIFALAGVAAAGTGILTGHDDNGRNPALWERILSFVFALAVCIIVPLILYGLFTRYRLADSWSLGLPSISDDEWTATVRRPYWILFGTFLLFAAVRPLFAEAEKLNAGRRFAGPAIAAVIVAATATFWYSDSNFKAEIRMSLAADRCDWDEVLDIYRDVSTRHAGRERKALDKRKAELSGATSTVQAQMIVKKYDSRFFRPTRIMVMFRDLALLKQGKALDEAFAMRDGGVLQKSLNQIPMAFQAARQLYMNYGMVNMAYRWCLEDQVEHGWCFGTLKYMATYATLMNETEFAAKYFDKLDKTLFFRGWSRKHRVLSADVQAMSQELPYREIIPYMSFDDRMSNDLVKCETYTMRHFLEDRDAIASHEFDCAALLWAMRSQDIGMFWKALVQYLSTGSEKALPRHVQEAAYLYSILEKKDMGIPTDKSVRDSYDSFMNFIQRSSFSCKEEMDIPVRQKFGNTFYYFYYFVRGVQTF